MAHDRKDVRADRSLKTMYIEPIRFWGAPDTGNIYLTFYVMGADIINTDDPAHCRMFFEERLKVNGLYQGHPLCV